MEWTFVTDRGQTTIFWEKKQLGPVILHPVAMGSELHPSGSKLGTVGVTGVRDRTGTPRELGGGDSSADGRVVVCMWVEGLTHTRTLHSLSQLTLRICLRGTSPPRPIHQPGPNTPCATVDTGLTT